MTFSQCSVSVSQNCAFLLILSLKGGSWHLPALLCPFLNTVGEQRVLWLWIYGHLFSVIWLFIAAFSGTLTQEAPPSRLSSALIIKILVFEYQSASALADSKLPCLKVLNVWNTTLLQLLFLSVFPLCTEIQTIRLNMVVHSICSYCVMKACHSLMLPVKLSSINGTNGL